MGFSDLATVFADHAENLSRVLRAAGLLDSALFELSIEEPLVDLDPGQAGFSHGLLTNLSAQLSVVLVIEVGKDLDLIVRLALTVGAWHGACWSSSLLAHTFAGKDRSL